jgi:hypothetical protein
VALPKQNIGRKKERHSKPGCLVLFSTTYLLVDKQLPNLYCFFFFGKQNENGGMNLQKNHESTKGHNAKSQKLKFLRTFVSRCHYKFLNIGSTTHWCQMSKADAGQVRSGQVRSIS